MTSLNSGVKLGLMKKIDIKSIAKEAIQITDKVYIAFKKIPKKDLLEIEKNKIVDLLEDNNIPVINDGSIPSPLQDRIHIKSPLPKIMSIEIVGQTFVKETYFIGGFEYILNLDPSDFFGIDIRIHSELIKERPYLEVCDGKDFSPMGKYAEDLAKEILDQSKYNVTRYSSME